MADARSKRRGAGQQLLNEAARQLKLRRHTPDCPLLPQTVQYQRHVETMNDRRVNDLHQTTHTDTAAAALPGFCNGVGE